MPWQIAHGRSGLVVHTAVALACAPLFGVQWSTGTGAPFTSILTALVATAACICLGGFRSKLPKVGLLSAVTGAVIGFAPLAVFEAVRWIATRLDVRTVIASPFAVAFLAFALSIYVGTLAIGTYLMLLTILGIEQHQALSALAHPGYKHFVRLRASAATEAVSTRGSSDRSTRSLPARRSFSSTRFRGNRRVASCWPTRSGPG
ncbi:MAG TPA: hypothetical protein VM925_11800 [Labilithrix sp.]|nr:hypothetical protein [Labilithrix sp.]